MDKTVKDLKKLTNKGFTMAKTLMYYGYVPLICVLGLTTMRRDGIGPM